MKKIEVQVIWEVAKTVTVIADNLEEAMQMVENSMYDVANGYDYDSDYLDGTAEFVTEEAIIEDVKEEDYDKGIIL